MDKLRALQYFVAAAAEGSFSGAARRMDVTVQSVAKLVNALEREVGVRLIDRNTRGMRLTAKGEAYLEACRPLLEGLAQADRLVGEALDRPRGPLVVGAPSLLCRLCLVPALDAFHRLHPEVLVDLRPIDRLNLGDAASQGFDVIVALGWPGNVDLVLRPLAQSRLLVCASPEYWRRRGLPQRPADLRSHDCLLVRTTDGVLLDLWRHERAGETEEVAVKGRFVSESRDLVLQGVLLGQGVGRFADLSIWPHLSDGTLQPVMIDWSTPDAPPFGALYRHDVRNAERVRAFVAFAADLLGGIEARCLAAFGERPAATRPRWYGAGRGRASAGVTRGAEVPRG